MKNGYKDRIEAGQILADLLKKYKGTNSIILAIPRGGIPIGYVIASTLELPMEIVFSKKIGHPDNKEYAIGAVSLLGSVINGRENISEPYIKAETARIRTQLAEMRRKFTGNRTPVSISGKTVIVIDDGIATGNTMLETINILRKNMPSKIVLAIPVASRHAIVSLSDKVDDIICPLIPQIFHGVGAFYNHFDQVSDDEVIYFVEKLNQEIKNTKGTDTNA